jgi:hypothetical protein
MRFARRMTPGRVPAMLQKEVFSRRFLLHSMLPRHGNYVHDVRNFET